jgi:DNA invertase Pin-like site-specific DNA recombinase
MPRVVKIIPATLEEFTLTPLDKHTKKRVAGYARVSTDSEEQSSSYDTQVKYYSNYIKSKEDWDFVKVYTDEGISGTSTLKREGFKSMINDALDGKIDLIITKSVSRFARNTVDSLTTVRQLKEKGVEVYFEKENIWTLDSKGELLITIMSSLAQEESRSISENCTWGIRKRFEEGKVRMSYGSFLGFEKDDDGNIVINEREAKIVKYIYSRYLQGLSPNTIA